LKFPHLKWPKYLSEEEVLENQEKWRGFVSDILLKLQERARTNANDREMALGIIYVFLIDNEKGIKLLTAKSKKKILALETPKRKNLYKNLKEGRFGRSWSEDDIDINTDITGQILQVILNELENKMSEINHSPTYESPHRRKNALSCKIIPNHPFNSPKQKHRFCLKMF